MHDCARCENRWGGLNTAHCGACHETFTTVRAFDMHCAGSHSAGTRHCVSPAAVGLVKSDREYPCWRMAGNGLYCRKGRILRDFQMLPDVPGHVPENHPGMTDRVRAAIAAAQLDHNRGHLVTDDDGPHKHHWDAIMWVCRGCWVIESEQV